MAEDVPPLRWLWAERDRRRRAVQYWIFDPLTGLYRFATHYAARALPIDACSALGARFGNIAGRYSRQFDGQRTRLRENWTRLKPDGTDPALPHGVRDSAWQNIGRVVMEFAVIDRLWAAGRIAVEGAEHVATARASGRPVLVLGVHTGNWEVIWPTLVGLGHPTTLIYQPQGNRFEHAILRISRKRCGITLAPPWRAGALPAYRALLARKSVLVMFIDEFMHGHVHAPSFGRPLKLQGNIANVARMARMSNAVVIPVYSVRRGGAYFDVNFLPPVDLVDSGDAEADLAANVAKLDALVEPIVLKHLEQWFMLFDFRFDT